MPILTDDMYYDGMKWQRRFNGQNSPAPEDDSFTDMDMDARLARRRYSLLLGVSGLICGTALMVSVSYFIAMHEVLRFLWPLEYWICASLIVLFVPPTLVGCLVLCGTPSRATVTAATLFLVAASCLCVMQCTIVVINSTDRELAFMGRQWHRETPDPGNLCRIEQAMKCTGWESPCNELNPNADDCLRCPVQSTYPTSCRNAVREDLLMLLPIVSTVSALAAVGFIILAYLILKTAFPNLLEVHR